MFSLPFPSQCAPCALGAPLRYSVEPSRVLVPADRRNEICAASRPALRPLSARCRAQGRKPSGARSETSLEPWWDKFRGRLSVPATHATTGTFVLELEGQSVPVKSIEGGAAVGVVVIAAPAAGAHFREKHLSGVRYEPIALVASSRRPRRLFEWITTAWQGTIAQKNGAVIRVDVNGRPQAKREFVKAILVETTVPMLDAASNSTADFTVHLAPERTSDVTPPTRRSGAVRAVWCDRRPPKCAVRFGPLIRARAPVERFRFGSLGPLQNSQAKQLISKLSVRT
jgi:hypothetical protein